MIPSTRKRPSSILGQYHFRRVFAKRYTIRIGVISSLFSLKAGIFGDRCGGVRHVCATGVRTLPAIAEEAGC
jgi:hypothetical protein